MRFSRFSDERSEGVEPANERQVRRQAQSFGLVLRKSRRRDPTVADYNRYWLEDPEAGITVAGGEVGMTLDEVAAEIAALRTCEAKEFQRRLASHRGDELEVSG
jgi:hypothetical protein